MINYSIRCFLSFFHFLHSNVPDNQCRKQKWRVLSFTHIKLVARVLAYARAIARIKWRGLWHRHRLFITYRHLTVTRYFIFLVKISGSDCYLAFAYFFANFSLMLLVKVFHVKKHVVH